MLEIKNDRFYLTRGDSCALQFKATIPLYETDRAIFQITTPITPEGEYEVILEALLPPNMDNNSFVVPLLPEDTEQWHEGAYLWTLTVYQDPEYDEEGQIIGTGGRYTTSFEKGIMYIIGGKKNGNLE